MSRGRAAAALAAWLAVTLAVMPIQLLALWFSRPLAERIPVLYHRFTCRLVGARVEVVGTASAVRPTLFAFNHVSWLDISVISSLVPCCFVAKQEIGTWPFFGWLAKLQRSVFVARRRSALGTESELLRARLAAGDNLVLFPEGTSSAGTWVKPFKSAFFAIAQAGPGAPPVLVQPASIAYLKLSGMPIGRQWREGFAWYGDMDLVPHFWQIFGLGRFLVRITFHEPLDPARFGSRKALSEACLRAVAAGVAAARAGRRGMPALAA